MQHFEGWKTSAIEISGCEISQVLYTIGSQQSFTEFHEFCEISLNPEISG